MAALYEELTLFGLQGVGDVQGVESAGDGDRVLVTEAERTVTLYKVSDQRPLGSWAVKQGQRVTAPAVYCGSSEECAVIHDDKVLRVWKEEDVSLEKVFKTTLSAEVSRIHSRPDAEPLVLFRCGAVRPLDSLLADPRQEVQNVLTEGESIRWSEMFVEDGQPIIMYITEKAADFYVNVWMANLRASLRYKLQAFTEESRILNFAASSQKNALTLLVMCSTGVIFQALVPLVPSNDVAEPVLSVSPLLHLSEPIESGALALLDDSNLATLTASAAKQKDHLCIWNTSFQTLQHCKEFSQPTSYKLWHYYNTLYVPCRNKLRVFRYACEPPSLASAMGKASDVNKTALDAVPIVSWETLTGSKSAPPKSHKKASRLKRDQAGADEGCLSQVALSDIQEASEAQISCAVRKAVAAQHLPDFPLAAGKLVQSLLGRCRGDPNFYPQSPLMDLVETGKLSYSLCPGLVALGLEKADVRLLQLCLRRFLDVPEAVVCSCLKLFLGAGEDLLQAAALDTTSVQRYMEASEDSAASDDKAPPPTSERVLQNGFSPGSVMEHDGGGDDGQDANKVAQSANVYPVSLKRAVLLNTILTTAYSDTYLLPHLKDLTSDQVILFLSYLHFLYKTCSQQITLSLPGPEQPSVTQIIDWMNLLLDANFTVLVVLPKAKSLLRSLQKCVRQQMKFYSELNKIEGSLTELKHLRRPERSGGKYSIEILKLY